MNKIINKINFNSHAHVERDVTADVVVLVSVISTHTLTWSVTFEYCQFVVYRFISTHTLTWSVTTGNRRCKLFKEYFNSHAHVERDVSTVCIFSSYNISTHTLTWSVTTSCSTRDCTFGISTHTLTWSVTLNRTALETLC